MSRQLDHTQQVDESERSAAQAQLAYASGQIRPVLQMTNWDGVKHDQEWKRRKALDAKARRQDPSIPPPGMKVTAVQRLVRRGARDR